MTNEEVLEYLKSTNESPYESVLMRISKEALGKVIESLEKQVPKKPLLVPYEESRLRTYKCPTCGSYELRLHCDICGQKLDWGNENES